MAGADVAGFKGATLAFTDVPVDGRSLGVSTLAPQTIFKQGKLMRSDGAFDMAIDGAGFFRVHDASGRHGYTRSGEFTRAADGTLQNAQGWTLDGVRVPSGASAVHVTENGAVTATTAHGTRNCGTIRLAVFASPEHLRISGGTVFFATPASGSPHHAPAVSHGGARIRFGVLEQSNVSIVEAMMQIMAAQRAYEANAKGVQAADEMLRIADNLSRA